MKVQEIITGVLSAADSRMTAVDTKASSGFSDIMSKVSTEKQSVFTKKNTKKQLVSSKESSSAQESVKNKQNGKIRDVQKSSAQNTAKKGTRKENNVVSKEMREAVENKIQEVIKQDLKVSDEELAEAMSVLGLSYLDLLNSENMKMLAMQLKGVSGLTDVLMDDELSMMLTQVLEDVTTENMAELTGATAEDMEQLVFRNMLETKDGMTAEEVVLSENQVLSETGKTLQQTEVAASQAGKEDVQADNILSGEEKLPEVSVVKELSSKGENLSGEQQGKDAMPNQSELADAMINQISSSVTETVSSDGTITMTTVEMRQITIQIVQQIKVVIHPEQTTMQMTLHPEHLGRLQLAVTSKDGVMTASFTVQNEMVKQALEAQMLDLKNAFTEQGLKVEAVEVNVSSFEFTQEDQTGGNQQQEQKKARTTSFDVEDAIWTEDELTETEERAVAAISGSGNNVNYTV